MTRLIGGNISSTPIKDISDGSAFSAGGGGAPVMPVIGTPGTATQITASNWARAEQGETDGLGNCHAWLQMSQTLVVNVFRENVGNGIWAGCLEFDGNGDVSTEYAANDLTSDFTSCANGLVRVVQISPTRLTIVAAKTTSPRRIEVGTYDISSGVLTRHGSIQTFTTATDDNAAIQMCGAAKYDENTVVVTFQNNSVTAQIQMVPFKITTTQAVGSAVAAGVSYSGQTGSRPALVWKSLTNVFTWAGPRIFEWSVTPGATPSVTFQTDHFGTDATLQPGAPGPTVAGHSRPTSIIQPDTPSDDGQAYFLLTMGGVTWTGKSGRFPGIVPMAHHSQYIVMGYGYSYTHTNGDIIKLDESGDYIRGMLFAEPGTTAIDAYPFIWNTATGGVTIGERTQTTNFSPHTLGKFNSGCAFFSAGPHVMFFGEDVAAAPSYIKIPVTLG